MRDPAEIRTKKGTSMVVVVSRGFFIAYFLFFLAAIYYNFLPGSELEPVWLMYLVALYFIAERFYAIFMERGIDLGFAFPLLFAVYMLNLVSLIFRAQESFPLLNRAEHFASFVLLGYVVWIFFLKYLPQKVWRKHPYYTSILVLAVTSLFGVANEIVELILDSLFQTQYIGLSHFDTALDLLMNTLGAGAFLVVRLILGTAEAKKEQQK